MFAACDHFPGSRRTNKQPARLLSAVVKQESAASPDMGAREGDCPQRRLGPVRVLRTERELPTGSGVLLDRNLVFRAQCGEDDAHPLHLKSGRLRSAEWLSFRR